MYLIMFGFRKMEGEGIEMIYYLIVHLVCMFIGCVLMARAKRDMDAETIVFLILTGPFLFIIMGMARLVVNDISNNTRKDGE